MECLLQDLQERTGLQCTFTCSPETERRRFGRDAEIAIFRIVQEALTNVQRHAEASSVRLEAQSEEGNLLLFVTDDGKGMRVPAQPTTFGLLGMRERAHALGGHLEIASANGQGTTMKLVLNGAT